MRLHRRLPEEPTHLRFIDDATHLEVLIVRGHRLLRAVLALDGTFVTPLGPVDPAEVHPNPAFVAVERGPHRTWQLMIERLGLGAVVPPVDLRVADSPDVGGERGTYAVVTVEPRHGHAPRAVRVRLATCLAHPEHAP